MIFSAGDFIQLSIFFISLSVFAQKPVPLYLRLFPFYLFLLMIVNMVIEYTTPLGIHNTIIINIGSIAEFSLYFYVIRSVIVNRKVKKRFFYTTIAFVVFAVVNLFFIQNNDRSNPINFTVGTVISVIFCIYYFFELFQITETQSLAKLTGFWIVSGILFNVVLVFPMNVSISFMEDMSKANQKTMMIVFNHFDAIYNIISVLTYILYSIGFIGRIRTCKSIS